MINVEMKWYYTVYVNQTYIIKFDSLGSDLKKIGSVKQSKGNISIFILTFSSKRICNRICYRNFLKIEMKLFQQQIDHVKTTLNPAPNLRRPLPRNTPAQWAILPRCQYKFH